MSFKTILVTVLATIAVGSVQAFSGDGTFYTPDGNTGACGHPIKNTEHAVALNPTQYQNGKNCGRKINVHHDGKMVQATVKDLCPGCSAGDVDLTPSAFKKLAKLEKGRIHVTWQFA